MKQPFCPHRSIARQTGVTMADLKQAPPPTFEHPKEWNLAKLVIRFPEVIDRCANDLYLHNLCDYLYELATTFTEFYDNCYVVEKDKSTGKTVTQLSGQYDCGFKWKSMAYRLQWFTTVYSSISFTLIIQARS